VLNKFVNTLILKLFLSLEEITLENIFTEKVPNTEKEFKLTWELKITESFSPMPTKKIL